MCIILYIKEIDIMRQQTNKHLLFAVPLQGEKVIVLSEDFNTLTSGSIDTAKRLPRDKEDFNTLTSGSIDPFVMCGKSKI